MSKTSFRSKNIEPDKPIPIYGLDELRDIADYTAVSRSVVQMPTGMEKEEESEQHLKAAMHAQSVYGGTRDLVIPFPEVFELSPPRCLDYNEFPSKYDMDSEDEQWLQTFVNLGEKLDSRVFEKIIEKLEWLHKFQSNDLKTNKIESIFNISQRVAQAIFDYWREKRKSLPLNYSLVPEVKVEQAEGTNSHDPYVAFRKRFEKMQTRKNRKIEEGTFERIMQTYVKLLKVHKMLDAVCNREALNLQLQQNMQNLFEARCAHEDHGGSAFKQTVREFINSNLNNHSISLFASLGVVEAQVALKASSSWRLSLPMNPVFVNKMIIENFTKFKRTQNYSAPSSILNIEPECKAPDESAFNLHEWTLPECQPPVADSQPPELTMDQIQIEVESTSIETLSNLIHPSLESSDDIITRTGRRHLKIFESKNPNGLSNEDEFTSNIKSPPDFNHLSENIV
ncbi:Enhancer of polycomb 1 [Thelohanellus kitauei]|uniref:Enhancer of polycomb 1 n=1 Tax=Thelohanellus kitauei TaxID=669202 RepID=A0A0C2MQY0_THEKT|nr:Enhancer of polycomb 1 [Thelohanellus kitauei]